MQTEVAKIGQPDKLAFLFKESTMSYTKGDWNYEVEDGFCSMLISEDGDIVCQFDQDPKEADVSLMKAAPDLLEALQEIEDVASFIPIEDRRDRRQLGDALDKARAAIAKALGN